MSFDFSSPSKMLAEARFHLGLSTRWVAQTIGVSAQSISFFERTKKPGPENLRRLKKLYCYMLGAEADRLEKQAKGLRLLQIGLSNFEYPPYIAEELQKEENAADADS